MDPLRALVILGGGARANALLELGVTWPALRAALLRGQVVRPARGTYVLPQVDSARSAAAALRGHVGCVSACDYWGIQSVAPPDTTHIVVPEDRNIWDERRRSLGLIGVHRQGNLGAKGLVESVGAAVDHAAHCTRPIEQLVLVNSAMKLGKLDPMAALDFVSGDLARREWLARLAGRTSHSVPESVALAVLDAAGFRPRRQDPHDNVGHIDLGVGARHGVEVDGWDTHGNRAAFAEDRRRDREMAALRKWPIRYTYADVMKDPRAFGLDVARVVGLTVSSHYEKRMNWLMAVPHGHLNRRTEWRPTGI